MRFLQQIGETDREFSEELADTHITGINIDQNATLGEFAWLSAMTVADEPERIRAFKGSLLITPINVAGFENPVVMQCRRPKLAFILTVNRFFAGLSRTDFPALGQNPVYPGTEVGSGVSLAAGVVIGSGVRIFDEVSVGPNTVLANCVLKSGCRIGANCSIGLPGFGFDKDETGKWWRFPHIGKVIIEEDVEVGSNTCIDRGSIGDTVLGRGVKVDNLVQVAHNVNVGENSLVIADALLGGSATIGRNVWIAPSATVMNQITVGDDAFLGMGAKVIRDVAPWSVVVGNPARVIRSNKPQTE